MLRWESGGLRNPVRTFSARRGDESLAASMIFATSGSGCGEQTYSRMLVLQTVIHILGDSRFVGEQISLYFSPPPPRSFPKLMNAFAEQHNIPTVAFPVEPTLPGSLPKPPAQTRQRKADSASKFSGMTESAGWAVRTASILQSSCVFSSPLATPSPRPPPGYYRLH